MARTPEQKKADRDAASATKRGSNKPAKPEKVKARQQPGGATHGSWSSRTEPAPIDKEARALRRQFKRRASKVLYFVRGAMPSAEDYVAARAIGPGVVFRNALKIVGGAPMENCDAVAGAVPEDYANTFPSAEEDHIVDEENRGLAEGVIQPERSPHTSGSNAPDDARPGTVSRIDTETGKEITHASGTGAEKTGGLYPHPMNEQQPPVPPDGSVAPTHRQQAAEWKSNKVD